MRLKFVSLKGAELSRKLGILKKCLQPLSKSSNFAMSASYNVRYCAQSLFCHSTPPALTYIGRGAAGSDGSIDPPLFFAPGQLISVIVLRPHLRMLRMHEKERSIG